MQPQNLRRLQDGSDHWGRWRITWVPPTGHRSTGGQNGSTAWWLKRHGASFSKRASAKDCGLLPSGWVAWITMHFQGPDELAPWLRRFGTGLELKAYTFGAFDLYTHPTDSHFPSSKAVKDKCVTRKLRNRLVPAFFVGVSIGPGCQWAQRASRLEAPESLKVWKVWNVWKFEICVTCSNVF